MAGGAASSVGGGATVYRVTTPRTPDWVWEMHRQVAQYAIPFAFGGQTKPSSLPDINAATCVAVEFGKTAFLITAGHVLAGAVAAKERLGRDFSCQFGNVRLDLEAAQTKRDPSLDLATIAISGAQLSAIEREHVIVRPDVWPPPELALSDPVLFVGYPKSMRITFDDGGIDFRSGSKLGLIHRLLPNGQLLIQHDPEFVDGRQVGWEEAVETELGGYSGGPGFLVRQEPILVPRLCAVVSEGARFFERACFVTLVSLSAVSPDGDVVAPQSWDGRHDRRV